MKKIGILTFHRAHNYGAMLQAYALLEVLKDYNSEIIDYYNPNIYKRYNVKLKLKKNIFKMFEEVIFYKRRYKRFKSFENFIRDYLKISRRYDYQELLYNLMNDYDIMITGSDQVWNPKIVSELSLIYTLNFGNERIKRISYAASTGSSKYVLEYKDEFINALKCINNISVREENTKDELDKIILDKKVDVVLDPTLLLSKDEWNKKLENINVCKEKYILTYVVKKDKEFYKIVNYLEKKTGLKVIHFEMNNLKYKNVLKNGYTSNPLEFINLIKNAEYVVATSFHATVFSVLFNKKFFIVPHKKTGERVTNLLSSLGIEGRTFSSLDDFKNIDYNFETDWESVEKNLKKEREKSINWLKNAIEG